MNIVDRLKIYMEHTGLPITQFADAALIPRPTLSQILSGRNKKISNEILEKLHTAFPSLNVAWLLFGDGNMLKGNASQPQPSYPQSSQPQPSQTIEDKVSAPSISTVAAQAAAAAADNIPANETQYEKSQDPVISLAPDTNKKIQTIMVFYTDNSFEIFTPSPR